MEHQSGDTAWSSEGSADGGGRRGALVCCAPSLFLMRGPGVPLLPQPDSIACCPCGCTFPRAVPAQRPWWPGPRNPAVSQPCLLAGWHVPGAESAVNRKGFLNSTSRFSVHIPEHLRQQGGSAKWASSLRRDVIMDCFFSRFSQAENESQVAPWARPYVQGPQSRLPRLGPSGSVLHPPTSERHIFRASDGGFGVLILDRSGLF